MIEVEIPGLGVIRLRHAVLDVNGTIAKDGRLIEGVSGLLRELAGRLNLHLVTADTFGIADAAAAELGLAAVRIPPADQARAKLDYVERLGADEAAAIGNGTNDAAMLARAALGIAVLGPEGCSVEALLRADVAVCDLGSALELLLFPKRLAATLRR